MVSKMTENNYKIILIITQKVITLQLFLKAIYKTLAKVVIKIVITKFFKHSIITLPALPHHGQAEFYAETRI